MNKKAEIKYGCEGEEGGSVAQDGRSVCLVFRYDVEDI
eukprot:gene24632-10589_t